MIKNIILATLLFPLMSFADGCASIPVEFHDAYALTTDQDDEALSVFVTVVNRDPVNAHTITGVSSPGATTAVFQVYARNSQDDDSVTGVSDEVVIPPLGMYMFRPGHMHIWLNGYKERPNPDDTISLTFEFANECYQTIDHIPVDSPH